MTYLDGYFLRRHVALDDLVDAVAAAFEIDRAALTALDDVTDDRAVVAYAIAHHATGFATQLELYRLPRAPDSPAMASRLARRLGTEVVCSPPAGVVGHENPYLWVLARPSGEVGLEDDDRVFDAETVALIPWPYELGEMLQISASSQRVVPQCNDRLQARATTSGGRVEPGGEESSGVMRARWHETSRELTRSDARGRSTSLGGTRRSGVGRGTSRSRSSSSGPGSGDRAGRFSRMPASVDAMSS